VTIPSDSDLGSGRFTDGSAAVGCGLLLCRSTGRRWVGSFFVVGSFLVGSVALRGLWANLVASMGAATSGAETDPPTPELDNGLMSVVCDGRLEVELDAC
jgi:hypothetical protein